MNSLLQITQGLTLRKNNHVVNNNNNKNNNKTECMGQFKQWIHAFKLHVCLHWDTDNGNNKMNISNNLSNEFTPSNHALTNIEIE